MQDQERRRKQVAQAVKIKTRISTFLILTIALALIAACASSSAGTPAVTNPPPPPTPAPGQDGTQPPATATDEGGAGIAELATLAQVAPTRTLEPTATPDALAGAVEEIAQDTGLAGRTLLWLGFEDWFNLGLSILFVLGAFLISSWAIRWLFPRLVRRTKTDLDDRLLQISGAELRWLVVVLILSFATRRLGFVRADLKTALSDVYFLLAIFLAIVILFRLIILAAEEAELRAIKGGRKTEAESLIALSVWALRLVVIILAVSLALTHFGINIAGFTLFLGIAVLALSLAGRDVLADVISGAIILIDQPYRIGDRLELPSIASWGDVVDIGMRSTKILSMENRMVVIPNSVVGKNQVVNYSYPDPSYFNLVKVMVAYDNDPDEVSRVLELAIRSVEGVQTEREVVAWLIELTEYQMVYWTAWWVATYADRYSVQDRVIRAMMRALKEAGVILPYTKGHVELVTNPETNTLSVKNDDNPEHLGIHH